VHYGRQDGESDERRRNYPNLAYDDDDQDPYVYKLPDSGLDQTEEELDNGEADVGDAPLKYLLIRGLKPNVNEQTFAKGLDKLYRKDNETGATPNSLKRVFLIRNRRTEQSLGYGVAEYFSVRDATDALDKARLLGPRCTISSRLVNADFPHLGVFPDVNAIDIRVNPDYTFEDNGIWRQYRDNRSFASEHFVNDKAPSGSEADIEEQHVLDDSKNDDSLVNKKRPSASQGLALMGDEPKHKKSRPQPKGLAIAQHWNSKRAELMENGEEVGSDDLQSSITHPPQIGTHVRAASLLSCPVQAPRIDQPSAPIQSFVYVGPRNGEHGKYCLLCGLKLPEQLQPERHVRESAKHRENIADPKKTAAGLERIRKWGLSENDTLRLSADVNPVDHFTEDDVSITQSLIVREPMKINLKARRKTSSDQSDVQSSEESSASAQVSKGLRMLQRAGWTPGQSLGNGLGLAKPIEQNVYASGVGLGHEGSRQGNAIQEAQRLTKNDRSGFLEKTRELARERFERMH